LEVIEFYISRGVSPNARDAIGMTPLIVAAQHGQVKACVVLLESGADLTALSMRDGLSAIEVAAAAGHSELARFLKVATQKTDSVADNLNRGHHDVLGDAENSSTSWGALEYSPLATLAQEGSATHQVAIDARGAITDDEKGAGPEGQAGLNKSRDRRSMIEKLIARGTVQGHLTYSQINECIPMDIVDPEAIEEVVNAVNDAGIPVCDAGEDDSFADHAGGLSETALERQLGENLHGLLSELTPREATVIRLLFGVDGQPKASRREICARLDVSFEVLTKIEAKAMRRLRRRLNVPNRWPDEDEA
jgi:hypothetical protein